MKSEKSVNKDDEKTISEIIDSIGFGVYQIRLLVICGLLQTADAMEMLLLSVLGPVLKCEWGINDSQIAWVTTVVFLGMGVGAPLFGFFADLFGRRGILIASAFFTFYFGCLSGFSPYLVWILIMRCLVGCGIGGMMSTISTITSELTPTSMRGKCIIFIMAFWSIGALLECLLAFLITRSLGWQWLCVFSALPVMVAMFSLVIVPESPQFLLLQGSVDKVKEIIDSIAKLNKKPLYEGRIKAAKTGEIRGNVLNMFHRNIVITTILTFIIWFASGFTYYGNVLLATTLPTTPYHCLQDRATMSDVTYFDRSCCVPFTDQTYIDMTIATLGELGTFPVVFLLSEFLGRRWCLGITSMVSGITIFALDFCMGSVFREILMMINRTSTNSAFVTAYIYTVEVYPTSIRSVSLGVCSAMARIGAIITPFVAQVLLPSVSVVGALTFYSLVSFLAALASALLPIETKGRLLAASIHEMEKEGKTDSYCNDSLLCGEKSDTNNDYATFK